MAHHETESQVLNQIEEGMKVVDADGDEVGEVKDLYLGTTSDEADVLADDDGAVPDRDPYPDGIFEELAEAFVGADEMPEELRERLLNKGFIVIDGGLLGSTRVAESDQIAGVREGKVHLRNVYDALYKI